MPGHASYLAPAAIYITCILGPLHLIAAFGYVFLRNKAALTARVPRISIFALFSKAIAFFLLAWLFMDPNCPCIVTLIMWWLDWIANSGHVLQKIILLWRCEIQLALEKSRTLPTIAALDEKNLFVRFRQVLRPRTQSYIMLAIFLFCGIYNVTLMIYYRDYAMQPCIMDHIGDNPMVLTEIILCWVTFVPVFTFSSWSMRRLARFPEDNWKIYFEARILTPYTGICAIACLVVLAVVPTVEGILFVHFVGPVWGSMCHLIIPLHLHRKTVQQLAQKEITSLTSFERLLLNESFLTAFGTFLKKEFSSENLYFWLEVHRLAHDYGALLPHDKRPEEHEGVPEDPDEMLNWMRKGAQEIQHLGSQCVGERAPWQINISGFTAQDLGKAMKRIYEMSTTESPESLQEALEEVLKTLVTVQHEVFELLRKDPYPRFLLTDAAEKLNHDEHFKRMLAAEKLEDEAQKHKTSSNKRTTTVDEGSSGKGSKGSGQQTTTTKEGKKSRASGKEKPKKRSSHLFAYSAGEKENSSDPGSRASDLDEGSAIEKGISPVSPFQRIPVRSQTTTTLQTPSSPYGRKSESNSVDVEMQSTSSVTAVEP